MIMDQKASSKLNPKKSHRSTLTYTKDLQTSSSGINAKTNIDIRKETCNIVQHTSSTKECNNNKTLSFSPKKVSPVTAIKLAKPSVGTVKQATTFSKFKKHNYDLPNKTTSPDCHQSDNQWKQLVAGVALKNTSTVVIKEKDLPLDIGCLDVGVVQYTTLEFLQSGIEKCNDFATCKRFLVNAFNRPGTILVQLVVIIESLKNLSSCISAVRSLHDIIVFAMKQNKIQTDELFSNFHNFTALIDSLAAAQSKYQKCKKYKDVEMEWQLKVLNILEVLCTQKQWRSRFKNVNKPSIGFFVKLLANKSPNVEFVNHLLALIRILCVNKSNCQILSCKEFYGGLCDAFYKTRKTATISEIFQRFVKIRTICKYLQESNEVLSLLIDMIAFNPGKYLVTKRKIMDMLYKLSTNSNGTSKILRFDEYFLKLLFYFMRKGKPYEYTSQIKALSLLNRSLKHVALIDDLVDLGFELPSHLIPSVKETRSTDEDDSDQSEEDGLEISQISVTSEMTLTPLHEPTPKLTPLFQEMLECKCSENRCTHCSDKNCINKLRRSDRFESFQGNVFRLKKIDQLAYPDAVMIEPTSYNEFVSQPRCDSSTTVLSKKLRSLRAGTNPKFPPIIVYDLDLLYKQNAPFQIIHPKPLLTIKPQRINVNRALLFESRFECGNLRRAVQVEQYEYELLLSPDTYSKKGFQWFYFEVANMLAGVEYTFNVINFSKSKLLYLEGMRPLMFSIFDHQINGSGWKRTTGRAIYYTNHYTNQSDDAEYRTLTFSVTFTYSSDFVYFSYHYPYTYSRLLNLLKPLHSFSSDKIYLKLDKLCNTVNNFNEVPLLTITASPVPDGNFDIPYKKRPIIFLTARVHPGESNSSWIMEGIISFLLNENDVNAATARQHYIFKIVPMLNPEGVIYGNTRRGLTGFDLNRCWDNPNKDKCPEIYYTKVLVFSKNDVAVVLYSQLLVDFAKNDVKHPVAAFIDIHGHSKKKFFFLYGCNPKLSWNKSDKRKGDCANILAIIPNAIRSINANLRIDFCKNQIHKHKESTARVVLWREFNIKHSYTLECTYSEVAGKLSTSTKTLVDIGSGLITAFGNVAKQAFRSRRTIPSLMLDYGEWVTREIVQNELRSSRLDKSFAPSKAPPKKEPLKSSTIRTDEDIPLLGASRTMLALIGSLNMGPLIQNYTTEKKEI